METRFHVAVSGDDKGAGSRVEPSRLTALKTLRSPAPPPPPTGPSPRCLPVRAHACGLWRRLLSERARSAAPSWFGRPVRGPLTLLGCAVRREAPTRSPAEGRRGGGGFGAGSYESSCCNVCTRGFRVDARSQVLCEDTWDFPPRSRVGRPCPARGRPPASLPKQLLGFVSLQR